MAQEPLWHGMVPEVQREFLWKQTAAIDLTIHLDPFFSYFVAYELAKKALTPADQPSSQLNLGAIIMAGGTAGIAMWSIAIPPDVRCARVSRSGLNLTWGRLSLFSRQGHQIPPSIRSSRNVHRLHGLHQATHSQGRRSGTLEGFWSGNGSGTPKFIYSLDN